MDSVGGRRCEGQELFAASADCCVHGRAHAGQRKRGYAVVWRVVLRLTLCLRKKLRVASRYEVSCEQLGAGRAEERLRLACRTGST